MNKETIERILLKTAEEMPEYADRCAHIDDDVLKFSAAFIANIDAERGKSTDAKEMARTAPERIWIQVSDEPGDIDNPFPRPITDEMTWSTGQCVACEVEYVRADLSPTIQEGWPTDDMVVRGAETLHDSLRQSGCDHDFDAELHGTEIQQGIAESVFLSMIAAAQGERK